ncbi:MAG: L-proline glycine betaine binding transporter protein ProX [Actinomycetia bacterium]|nr:L-proline glycine betaine binding transporter protein ProX [Actinomycetes bacterium]
MGFAHRTFAVLCLTVILAALVACSSTSSQSASPNVSKALRDDSITVGSFDFAESHVLAEIYSKALEGGGYHVRRAFDLGPREFVAPALSRGLIEFVPEYAGTALHFSSLGLRSATSNVRATHDSLVRTLEKSHVTALAPAPAQDANTFVVTRATAAHDGLRTLSDVANVAHDLTFGGPPECPSRPQCLAGLEQVYGLKFKEFVRLDAGGPVTRQALKDGYVDVALLFTTDPSIKRDGLVELIDDRDLQPAENVIPLVRTEVVDHFGPGLVALVNAVSTRITTAVLSDLNAQVESGKSDAAVAATWLNEESLR